MRSVLGIAFMATITLWTTGAQAAKPTVTPSSQLPLVIPQLSQPDVDMELQNLLAATNQLADKRFMVSSPKASIDTILDISSIELWADTYKDNHACQGNKRRFHWLADIYANLAVAQLKISRYYQPFDQMAAETSLWVGADLVTKAERLAWGAGIQSVKVKQIRLGVMRQAKVLGVSARRPITILPDKKPELTKPSVEPVLSS